MGVDLRPLLAIDGDNLAHRAFHALPSSIKDGAGNQANMIVGFANMLLQGVGGRGTAHGLRGIRLHRGSHLPDRSTSRISVRPRFSAGPHVAARQAARAGRGARPPVGEGRRVRGRRLPGRRGEGRGVPRREDARLHQRPRPLPARQQEHDDPAPEAGPARARARRPQGGEGDLRRRARARARLRRPPRRPVRPHPGREGDRPRPCREPARQVRLAGGLPRSRRLPRPGRRAARLPEDHDAPAGRQDPGSSGHDPDWAGGSALAESWGLAGVAKRMAERAAG